MLSHGWDGWTYEKMGVLVCYVSCVEIQELGRMLYATPLKMEKGIVRRIQYLYAAVLLNSLVVFTILNWDIDLSELLS